MTKKPSPKRTAKTVRPARKVRTSKPARAAKITRPAKQRRTPSRLTRSDAEADREINKLRAYREQLQSSPPQGEGDARATLI